MPRTLKLFGRELFTFPVCYGLPTLFGTVLAALVWLMIWSYHKPPVRYTKIAVEQTSNGGPYVVLKLTKFVFWDRLCRGYAKQEIRPKIAVDNPKKVSGSPIPLDGHVINTPPHKGANGQAGDPTPERYIVLPAGQISPGKWEYKIDALMACLPWEYIWPIESDSATAEFEVR